MPWPARRSRLGVLILPLGFMAERSPWPRSAARLRRLVGSAGGTAGEAGGGGGWGGGGVRQGFGEARVGEGGADVHAFGFGVGGGVVGDEEEAGAGGGGGVDAGDEEVDVLVEEFLDAVAVAALGGVE